MNFYHRVVILLFLVVSVMTGSVMVAQNLNTSNLSSSPYNRYGYGRMGSLDNAVTRSMGGVGIAVRSNQFTTLANPASLTAIDTLTMIFSVGLDAQYGHYNEGAKSSNKWDAGFSYMSMHMPLWRNFALSLSLSPYSQVGYYYGTDDKFAIQSPVNKHDSLTTLSTHSGVGGINNFMMGIGWRPFRTKTQQANIGVNLGWIFGTIQHNGVLTTSTQANSTYATYEARVRGFQLEVGAQYTYQLNAVRSITVGGIFQPQLNLSADTETLKYSTDTITNSDRFRSTIKLPTRWGIGVTYSVARKLMISAEYEQTQWSKVMGFNPSLQATSDIFNDASRISIGAEYQPKVMTNSIWKASRYHAGLRYQTSYLRINESDLHELGANLGISMPINKRSFLDFGVGYTSLRPSDSHLVKEDYITFTLGITFNEMMFFRNRLR